MTTNFRRKATPALLIGAVALALALLPSVAATAATSTSSNTTTTSDTTGESGWVDVSTGQSGTFPTGENPYQAIANATGTTVVATPTTGAGSDVRVAPRPVPGVALSPDTSYALSAVWDQTGQTGDTELYVTTDPTICDGLEYGFPDLDDWNNRIKSFQSYNGCFTTLYQGLTYGGLQFGPSASSNNLGTFNDTAESLIASS